jgi:hypothetical protein
MHTRSATNLKLLMKSFLHFHLHAQSLGDLDPSETAVFLISILVDVV